MATARGTARRDLLLQATLQVVADEGVAAVTHRRVAAVAGVPLAATTYWFSSKEDLITTAFAIAAEEDIARLHELVAGDFTQQDTAAAVAAVLVGHLAEGRTILMASYVLMIEARHRPALRKISERWADAYSEAFVPVLRNAGSTDPAADVKLMLATLDGLLLKHLTGEDPGEDHLLRLMQTQIELLLSERAIAATAGR